MLKVSIIIPCFNVGTYIADALDACLGQTYKNIEIICIDNGSTDNTVNVIKQYKGVKLLQEEQRGAPFARNKGLLNCTGEWIQFLDADDILMPTKIAQQVDIILANPSASVIAGAYERQALNGIRSVVPLEQNDVWMGIIKTQLGITSSNLWKRNSLNEIGGWNTGFESSQEYELLFRILKHNYSVFIDTEINTVVRDRESGSISLSNGEKRWLNYVSLRISIIHFLKTQKDLKLRLGKYGVVVLGQIRFLSTYNRKSAVSKYNELIAIVTLNELPDLGFYRFLLSIFGFHRTQKILGIFGKF